VDQDRFYLVSQNSAHTETQKVQLLKDLEYLQGFLVTVEKKLSNDRFVQNAKPEVIEAERKKKADAESKIQVIEEALNSL
jgi:valyl-tRNA synthetase